MIQDAKVFPEDPSHIIQPVRPIHQTPYVYPITAFPLHIHEAIKPPNYVIGLAFFCIDLYIDIDHKFGDNLWDIYIRVYN